MVVARRGMASKPKRAQCCRQHGPSTKAFERWMKHLISKEEAREYVKSLQDTRRREQRRQQGKSGKRSQRPRYSVRMDILTQHIQLGTDGVGVTNGRHDTKRGTNSGASYFGDPLFARV